MPTDPHTRVIVTKWVRKPALQHGFHRDTWPFPGNVSTIEHVEKRDPSKKDADNPYARSTTRPALVGPDIQTARRWGGRCIFFFLASTLGAVLGTFLALHLGCGTLNQGAGDPCTCMHCVAYIYGLYSDGGI